MAKVATAGELNKLLLRELLDARADASMARAKFEMAEAKVSKVRAKIEAAGKQVRYDYDNGVDSISVVDVELG